ncbi:MAG TPA: hypothetical protein VEL11_15980 [Candidatus Bathyarchaeia archaeon]|nr:hypothetical protein [Candidatus Bathyarchaeia archaeon]
MKNGTAGPARYDIMTNQTACMDGYSHAWEDLCAKDGKTCVALFKDYGFLPNAGVVRNINGTTVICDFTRVSCGSTDAGTNTIVGTNQIIHWNTDAGAGWFGWKDGLPAAPSN